MSAKKLVEYVADDATKPFRFNIGTTTFKCSSNTAQMFRSHLDEAYDQYTRDRDGDSSTGDDIEEIDDADEEQDREEE
jgi:hypothetical protein